MVWNILNKYDKIALSGRTPFEVCCVPKEQRNSNDNIFVADYLYNNVNFFASMNIVLVAFISWKMIAQSYKENEKIIVKGEEGDWMYVIYKGTVEVMIEGRIGKPILIEAWNVFGQTALQNKGPRNATIEARTPTEWLILLKSDYDSVIFESIVGLL